MVTKGSARPFAVGVVSDEAAGGLDALADFIGRHHPDHVELNFVDGASVCDLDEAGRERVRTRLAALGVPVSLVGSRAFRGELDDDAAFERDLLHLRRACAAARAFGVGRVRVFSFRRLAVRDAAGRTRLHARLARAMEVAADAGVALLLENTGSGNLATTGEVRGFLAGVPRGALRLLWDPANAVAAGDACSAPAAFDALEPWIDQVHVKNVDFDGGRRVWTSVAAGRVDWPALLEYLAADTRDWRLTLDTHFRRGDGDASASTVQCLGELREMLRPWRA